MAPVQNRVLEHSADGGAVGAEAKNFLESGNKQWAFFFDLHHIQLPDLLTAGINLIGYDFGNLTADRLEQERAREDIDRQPEGGGGCVRIEGSQAAKVESCYVFKRKTVLKTKAIPGLEVLGSGFV